MLAHRLGMRMQQFRLSCQLLRRGGVRNFTRFLIVGIWGLRIDRNGFAARHVDDHIRTLRATVRIGDDHLRIEIHMFQQPGGFHDIPQLRLTPRAAHLVVAQRGRQGVGLAVKTGLLLAKPLELLAKRTHFPLATLFDLRNLLLQGIKILLHGRER